MTNTAFNTIKQQQSYSITTPACLSVLELSKKILHEFIKYRRVPQVKGSCCGINCQKCASLYLPKIISAVQMNKPVRFVLPAFPGKSPNSEKVLGALPDQAERLSLNFLDGLCLRIKKYYSPGVKIILCSDGRVFSDVVGMDEDNVTAYQQELQRMIAGMDGNDLSTFNLDDFYKKLHFKQMREELMQSYGHSLDCIKTKIRRGASISASIDERDANQMYRGITRFLFEDVAYMGQTKSRTTLQKESRVRAYEVIRKSNAWSALIAEHFPDAIRLSIHPQVCGAPKLGIRLIGNECWMTPWHGVAVQTDEGYVLLKRAKAEALGATLIYSADGRPSHYQLMTHQTSAEKIYAL